MKKSLLRPITKKANKYKTISARVPLDISDEFDCLILRAEKNGYTITPSIVIIQALRDAIRYENAELDKFERTVSSDVSPEIDKVPSNVISERVGQVISNALKGRMGFAEGQSCKCGSVLVLGQSEGKSCIKCPDYIFETRDNHYLDWI